MQRLNAVSPAGIENKPLYLVVRSRIPGSRLFAECYGAAARDRPASTGSHV